VSARAWAAARGIDFDHLDRERRHHEVAALGRHLMAEVGRLIPVLPVPLVATVLLREPGRHWSLLELKSAVSALVHALQTHGARLYVPRQDWDYAVGAGLRMLTLRHLVDEIDGLYAARETEQALLRYYANSIAHLLPTAEGAPVAPLPVSAVVETTR
jgi:glycerol-3-phosphate O-acyltransferase